MQVSCLGKVWALTRRFAHVGIDLKLHCMIMRLGTIWLGVIGFSSIYLGLSERWIFSSFRESRLHANICNLIWTAWCSSYIAFDSVSLVNSGRRPRWISGTKSRLQEKEQQQTTKHASWMIFGVFFPTEVRCNEALVWLLVEVYSVGSSMPSLRLVLFVEEQLGRVLLKPLQLLWFNGVFVITRQRTKE